MEQVINLDEFENIQIESTKITGLAINLHFDLFEGYNGEYNPNDPTDEPLLRFDTIFNKEFADNGSYCTCLSAIEDRKILIMAAQYILEEIENVWPNIKSVAEDLSYINAKDFKFS